MVTVGPRASLFLPGNNGQLQRWLLPQVQNPMVRVGPRAFLLLPGIDGQFQRWTLPQETKRVTLPQTRKVSLPQLRRWTLPQLQKEMEQKEMEEFHHAK